MKCLKVLLLCVFVFGNVNLLPASDLMEYTKAMQYLEERGEVCFTFYVNSPMEIHTLTNIVSIDNVKGTEVFAYANKQEFAEFLKYNYYYEVQTPPGLVAPESIKMSDYTGKGPYEWDSYPTYQGYVDMMNKFAADYPNFCKIEEIGTSINNRKLLAAKVTANVNTEGAKPKVFFQATIHGDELCGYVLMLRLIDYLLKNYNTDARVKRILDSMEIWINPDANPDGTYKGGDATVNGSIRYNANGADLNRTFPDPAGQAIQQQKENNAIMSFCDKYTFTLAADFHGGAEIIVYVWGCMAKDHPDKPWWINVCKEWAQVTQANAPSGYFSGTNGSGYLNAFAWYEVRGERMNHAMYKQFSRDVTVELSTTKKLGASSLPAHWDYQYRSFLNYIEQALYGIRGMVTDSVTGLGLKAKVFINSRDKDSSHVYSFLPHGDYYRPIEAGTFSLTFSCPNYQSKTITGVAVQNNKATILNVKLSPVTGIKGGSMGKGKSSLSVIPNSNGITLSLHSAGAVQSAGIYSMDGQLIKQLPVNQRQILWNGTNNAGHKTGNGCYIVRIVTNRRIITESFVFSR